MKDRKTEMVFSSESNKEFFKVLLLWFHQTAILLFYSFLPLFMWNFVLWRFVFV